MRGYFITIEGPEGSGKTSIVKQLIPRLEKLGYTIKATREPGGVPISEAIRQIILDKANTEMDAVTEALLYAASRRQHLEEVVRPALEAGQVVICDRFLDSSLAYQGYARGLGIDEVWEINRAAVDDLYPDLTLLIDIPPQVGLARIEANSRNQNRLDLETKAFHEKVVEGYHILAQRFPERIVKVAGDRELDDVVNACFEIIVKHLRDHHV